MKSKTNSHSVHRPTSIEVAKAAGVSRATVAFVFNERMRSMISPATQRKVLRAARKLGYHLDPVGRALSKGQSDEISFVESDPSELDPFVTMGWIRALQLRANDLNYSVGVHFLPEASRRRRERLTGIFARHQVGVILVGGSVTRAEVALARKMGVRVLVLFENQVGREISIRFPVEEMWQTAANHLLERGHRSVAYLHREHLGPVSQSSLQRVVSSLHSVVDPAGGTLTELKMDPTPAGARTVVDALLAAPSHPTAICGFKDEYCFLIGRELAKRGLRVPEDLAIICGSGDSRLCELSEPPLTSVTADLEAIAHNLVHIIDAVSRGKEPNPEWLVPPVPRLIVRASS